MLNGKIAIVTGSGSGIGKAIADKLSKNGATVVIAEFLDEQGKKAEKEIKNSLFIKCDVSSESDVKNLIGSVSDRFGRVDIIVNNAGLQYISKVEDFPLEKWNQLIGIMLTGAFLLIKYAVPIMKKGNWGRIINISSAHGKEASPWKAAYVSAKHGIIGLTKVVAKELAEFNITANSICPVMFLHHLFRSRSQTLQSSII